MARDSFDFDAVKLADGGFYHSAGDAKGNMMIGFGRRGRNKFVQLTQAEIAGFLRHGHAMLRTDDPKVKELLTALAAAIAPPPLTITQIITEVEKDPELQKRLGELMASRPVNDVIAVMSAEIAARK
jgi:hypothetical protein